MKDSTIKIFNELFERYPILSCVKESILNAFEYIKTTYDNGGTLFCAGNGGSSSDSEHIVGELLKSFKKKRAIDEQVQNSLTVFRFLHSLRSVEMTKRNGSRYDGKCF